MQNLLVVLFPLLIDGLNSVAGLENPKVRYWVALITSLAGGLLLNLPTLLKVIASPNLNDATGLFTVLLLIITATQGLYLKYWENHPTRSLLFPTVTGTTVKVPEPELAPVPSPEVAS